MGKHSKWTCVNYVGMIYKFWAKKRNKWVWAYSSELQQSSVKLITKNENTDCFFLHLRIFFCHLHTKHENVFLSFLCHPLILDYIIRKLILKLEIIYGLCNPKYIFKKWYSGLYNPEV